MFGEPGFFHDHEFRTVLGGTGRTLYESRRHFELNPGWTATPHIWLSNTDLIATWVTSLEDFDDRHRHLQAAGGTLKGGRKSPNPVLMAQ